MNKSSFSFFSVFLTLLTGCSDGGSSTKGIAQVDSEVPGSRTEFKLQFKAMVGQMELTCDDIYSGMGANEAYSIGVSDLRFYVSNLSFYDSNGEEIPLTLDDNSFQLNDDAGSVSLIDFSDTDSGFCELAAEGTPRTNTRITGMTEDQNIASVSFDVGVPQALMKSVITATDDVTDTPPPLSEMYWSWASGYRHFVFNFISMDGAHMDMIENSGLHIGSRDCGGAGKALSDQDSCGLLNTPRVSLQNFNPHDNVVIVDVAQILLHATAADFMGMANFGIQCHSAVAQSACAVLFPSFGLDLEKGTADPNGNRVFGME